MSDTPPAAAARRRHLPACRQHPAVLPAPPACCRDSFFCCAQSSKGYSGTATFVRTATALPFAAEEGFTLCCAGAAGGGGSNVAAPQSHPALAGQFGSEELAVSEQADWLHRAACSACPACAGGICRIDSPLDPGAGCT